MIWAWAQSVTAPTYWVTHEEGVKLIYNTDIYDMEGEGGGWEGLEREEEKRIGRIHLSDLLPQIWCKDNPTKILLANMSIFSSRPGFSIFSKDHHREFY